MIVIVAALSRFLPVAFKTVPPLKLECDRAIIHVCIFSERKGRDVCFLWFSILKELKGCQGTTCIASMFYDHWTENVASKTYIFFLMI